MTREERERFRNSLTRRADTRMARQALKVLDALDAAEARAAALRAERDRLADRLGPMMNLPATSRVVAYLSWERAQELLALAQPLVDVDGPVGKLAKMVCDLLRPGAALAGEETKP